MLKHMGSYSESAQSHANIQTKHAIAIQKLAMGLITSMSALREELSYAKQEVAFGVYSADDLESLLHQMEGMMIPLLGLSKISGFSIISSPTSKRFSPFAKLISATLLLMQNAMQELNYGLQHTELLLQANGLSSKSVALPPEAGGYENWREEKYQRVLDLARDDLTSKLVDRQESFVADDDSKDLDRSLLIEAEEHLYVLCLLQSASAAAQDLSTFVRSQLLEGDRRKLRLIFPRITHIPFLAIFSRNDKKQSQHILDPEHLPPRNGVERLGNMLRRALSTLGSDSSKFGVRIVAATMSIGILGFLKSTQHFFIEYRIVWAVVMIPISMSPTAGTAIYGFLGRALGVAAAMGLAYINWYIVDGKTGGVIVFFFLSMMLYYFLLLKYPHFVVLFILAAANHVLIIGECTEIQTIVATNQISQATSCKHLSKSQILSSLLNDTSLYMS
jgi:hypothetical protein